MQAPLPQIHAYFAMPFLVPDGAHFHGPVRPSLLCRLCALSELQEHERQHPYFMPAEMSMNGAIPILSDINLTIPVSKIAKKPNSNC